MRTTLVLAGLLLLLPGSAVAQETPKAEVFAGFSFLRANPKGGFVGSNASGWNASLAWNWNKWLGVKGDFAGHYCCEGQGQRKHDFLFGPQFNFRSKKASVFLHAPAGVSHGNAPAVPFSDTVLAWAGGGGVDIRLGERFALRVAQVDYFGTNYAGTLQHHFRYSGGLVFRFGGR